MPRTFLLATTLWMMAGGIASAAEPATATPSAAPATKDEPKESAQCVDVQVNGERVPDYACLGQLMRTTPATTPPPASPGSERIARRPPTGLGLAHRAATQQRMGNAFGVSTRPQRPPPPPPPVVIPGR